MIYDFTFQKRFGKIRLNETIARRLLDVEDDAPEWVIKNNYLKLAKKYHPDINRGSDELFKDINTAYLILTKSEFDIENARFYTLSQEEIDEIEKESLIKKPKEKSYYEYWKNRFF